jgi:hypothetical protein
VQAGKRSERNYTFRSRKKHRAGRKRKQEQNHADRNKEHIGKKEVQTASGRMDKGSRFRKKDGAKMTRLEAASSQMGSKQALNSMWKLANVKNFHFLYFSYIKVDSITNISGCSRI